MSTKRISNHFTAKSVVTFRQIGELKHKSLSSARFDYPTKDNSCLDYAFLSHRSSISFTESNLNKIQSESYLYDLVKTLEINFDCLKCFLKQSKIDPINNKELEILFEKLAKEYANKKLLGEKLQKLKSKVLIEKQILAEHKRKAQELSDYYKEKISENEENVANKEEYRKIYEKKLKDVEKYIHRLVGENKNNSEKYKKYANFKMNNFIGENTSLYKKKEELFKDIALYKDNISNIKVENNYIQESNVALTMRGDFKEESMVNRHKKYKEFMEKFKKQIRIVDMRMKFFKNCFKDMAQTLKYFNIQSKGKLTLF